MRKELGIGEGRKDSRAWPGAGHVEGKKTEGKQGVIWTPSLGSSVKALLWSVTLLARSHRCVDLTLRVGRRGGGSHRREDLTLRWW